MSAEAKYTCCEEVCRDRNSWRPTWEPCGKTAKFEREGKWYCGTHDPVKREEKRNTKRIAWRQKWAAEEEDRRLRSAAPDLLQCLKTAITIIGHPDDPMTKHFEEVVAKAEGRAT